VYKVSTLSSGLRVATAEMPHMNSVSVGIWIGVGSRYESPELNGACHFIEHLLFKGTKRRSARKISEAIEGIGGYLNAFTSEEATCFHARAAHERFPELLDVLTDMLLNSVFAAADVDKEREVIKEEIAMSLDEPQHHVQELLNATLWPDHALGRPITGTRETLDDLGRETLLRYVRGNYVAGNTVVVVAGRIRHSQALTAANQLAKKLPKGQRPSFVPAGDRQDLPRFKLFTRPAEQTQVALGIRTCSRHDKRRFALRLLNTVLGENMSSRLFQVLREDRGLAYSIYSTPTFFSDTGDLVISAGLDTVNVAKALKLIMRELRRMRETTPRMAEVRRARDYVIGQVELGEESTENQMNWVGEQILGYGKVIHPDRIKTRLQKVTPAEIRNAARDFFRPEAMNLALVSPLKSAAPLKRLLSV
jgi:predicted Zn-dependent peptidase